MRVHRSEVGLLLLPPTPEQTGFQGPLPRQLDPPQPHLYHAPKQSLFTMFPHRGWWYVLSAYCVPARVWIA